MSSGEVNKILYGEVNRGNPVGYTERPFPFAFPEVVQASISSIEATSAKFRYEIDKAGRIEYAVFLAGASYNYDEIVSGTGAEQSGEITLISANTLSLIDITNLSAGTNYEFAFFAETGVTINRSPIEKLPFVTKTATIDSVVGQAVVGTSFVI